MFRSGIVMDGNVRSTLYLIARSLVVVVVLNLYVYTTTPFRWYAKICNYLWLCITYYIRKIYMIDTFLLNKMLCADVTMLRKCLRHVLRHGAMVPAPV